MEEPQGGLLEGAETGLPGLAASPGGCAHAPEQTATSHANALGACPLEVQELKPPRSADGDPEQPRAPASADGDPEQPRPPRSADGDPEQPRAPASADGDPEQPRAPASADGDPEQPRAPRSADGDPEQPRAPRSADGDPEQPRAPRSADGDPEQPRAPRSAEGDPEQPRAPRSADGDPEQPRAPRSAEGDPEQPRAPASADGDLECLICCHRYRWERPPKVLSCQHTFCAVCLRLLLTVREDAWSVTCPLCRAATSVPGGLVCNLRDQAEILGRLARFAPEVRLAPQYLARPAGGELPGVGEEAGEDSESVNRVAARRLAVHLLLLGLLIFLILPFVYPGAFGWFLVSAMCAALLLSSAFCCLPGGRDCWGPAKALLPGQQKHSHVAAIA